ncbi:KICSTOR complex protein SZT2 isoform X2 [Lingula anatina]|uniref:KICSTOR complex protein SZT2 isoform X2 n=1 Tax=Lingula anatina TaxID=7574 RepID=A0A1S3JA22_LINAN|nr:KICSTOR complex protein SZT2 isoform X2 [Lingula anatina]|eukprot:XP_013407252.1 KICSTOR complex protein SZT2 isoform X2 [Lingula anatina]
MVDEDVSERQGEILEAGNVYVLMKREYRISRNIRALWYFGHLNQVIEYTPKSNLSEYTHEIEVISVVPREPARIQKRGGKRPQYRLTSNTVLTFFARRYRLVYALDLSPSSGSVDINHCSVLITEVFLALKKSLLGLAQPFYIPGSLLRIEPQLYITVVTYAPIVSCKAKQVLVQGCHVTHENVEEFLAVIKEKITELENYMAQSFEPFAKEMPSFDDDESVMFGLYPKEDGNLADMDPQPDSMVAADSGFVNLLRYGILALQLLPENSSAGIIIITDGVVSLPDALIFESLLAQLRNSTVTCSVLQIGSGCHANNNFGLVPCTELLQFLAKATFGAYFKGPPVVTSSDTFEMNCYHKALFGWKFKNANLSMELDGWEDVNFGVRKPLTLGNHSVWESPPMRKKHMEKNLHANILDVISVRLREGFTIKNVAITRGESQIEVHLVLPWRDNVRIEYLAIASWPIIRESKSKTDTVSFKVMEGRMMTHVEVTTEGCYEFLHDVTCTQKKPFRSPYRTAMVKTFWLMQQGLTQVDQLMVHIQSFASNPAFYTIPENIKSGVPLFVLPTNSPSPQLYIQQSSKDTALSQFASFWKPIMMLDINIWQKWMHTHRIGIILEHDMPLPKHLHIPNSNSRFNTVMCRQALTSMNELLKDWSSFILMENHSYIKLIGEPDKPPSSFYVIRVTSKPPCMVLRVAFPTGTPGHKRNEIVNKVKAKLLTLNFPQRGTQKEGLSQTPGHSQVTSPVQVWKPPLQRQRAEIRCCILMNKPVEKILIRYEKIPEDFMSMENPYRDSAQLGMTQVSLTKSASSLFTTLSKYLYHRRWVWSVQDKLSSPPSLQAIGRVLTTLSKIRLQEGFHFAHTSSGIVNMVVEMQMKDPKCEDDTELQPCVMQYVLFPPHTTTKESFSESDTDVEERAESDGEIQIITECWIEPQYGNVVNKTPERNHYDGLDFKQLANALFPVDEECISTMLTLEHLINMCQEPVRVLAPATEKWCPVYSEESSQQRGTSESAIHCIPFPFDLMKLLPKCQQVEILFSTFIEESTNFAQNDPMSEPGTPTQPQGSPAQSPNAILFQLLSEQLKDLHDREVEMNMAECGTFVQLIQKRTRDVQEQPYPFTTANITHESTPEKELDLREIVSRSILSSCTDKTISQHSVTAVQGRQTEESHGQESRSGCGQHRVPRWNCYVKTVGQGCVIVTFIPATYLDLISLAPSSSSGEESSMDREMEDAVRRNKIHEEESQTDVIENPEQTQCWEKSSETDVINESFADIPDTRLTSEKEASNEKDLNGNEQIEYKKDSYFTSKKSLTLPMFIYQCSMSSLTEQLVSKWSYMEPQDIFQDMTFTSWDMEEDVMEPHATREGSQDTVVNRGEEEGSRSRQDTLTSPVKDKLHVSFDRRSTEIFTGAEELRNHCNMMCDAYYKSFVTGVYKSLQQGQEVSGMDTESAISSICQESVPLQIDITRYLQTVCGHIQKVIERHNKEQCMKKDLEIAVPKSHVIFARELGDVEEEIKSTLSGDSGVTMSNPNSNRYFQPSRAHIKFPVSKLTCRCTELVKGLHKQIKKKFADILAKNFRSVSSCPDYFYYRPPLLPRRPSGNTETEEEKDPFCEDPEKEETEDDIFRSDADEPPQSPLSPAAIYGGDSPSTSIRTGTMSSFLGDEIGSLNMEDDDNDEDVQPLFLHLSCTVKTKSIFDSVPVGNLVTCLNEFCECFEDEGPDVDLGELTVTLDIICLTLPQDTDLSTQRFKPNFNRAFSIGSAYSSSPPGDPANTEETMSASDVGTSYSVDSEKTIAPPESPTRAGFRRNADPLANLPVVQKQAVNECKAQIEWLLKDEIASGACHISPPTVETLEMVSRHVQESKGKLSCITEQVPLQFVYGPQQSRLKFIEEFERMNIPGYYLLKEGDFYYLVVDKATLFLEVHANAIKSALDKISRDNSPTRGEEKKISDVFMARSGTSEPDLSKEAQSSDLDATLVPGGVDSATTSLSSKLRTDNGPVTFNPVISLKEPTPDRTASADPPHSTSDNTSGSSVQVLDDKNDSAKDLSSNLMQFVVEQKDHVTNQAQEAVTSGSSFSDTVTAAVESAFRPRSQSSKDDVRRKPQKESLSMTESCDKDNTALRIKKSASSPSMHDGSEDILMKEVDMSSQDVRKQGRPRSSLPQTPVNGASMNRSRNSSGTPKSIISGIGTPNRSRHSSGTSRSRHSSGKISRKMSGIFDSSSHGSCTEEGYEGDSSDSDAEGGMLSMHDTGPQQPRLPDFWLLMKVNRDKVDIFFHTSYTGEEETEDLVHMKILYNNVISNIRETGRIVNQRLLLQDLHDTRMCNSLLVPEADEDISWKRDLEAMHASRRSDESDEEEDLGPKEGYLAAALDFEPGHFACDCVWKHQFTLHPRLKTGLGRTGLSRGIQALRSVLNAFSVNNRKNMFVLRENNGNVFYLRVSDCIPVTQSVQLGDSGGPEDQVDGSKLSEVAMTRDDSSASGFPFSKDLRMRRLSSTDRDPEMLSLSSSTSSRIFSRKNEECIELSVHGITDAGPEIKEDLIDVLKRKMDDAVLDVISVMLARNAMCKLTVDDVQFIQRPFTAPKEVLRLVPPAAAMHYLFAFMHYLRQNMRQFLFVPNYIDNKEEHHFLDYSEEIPSSGDVFLYNRPHATGRKGIACVHLRLVEGSGSAVQPLGGSKPSPNAYQEGLDPADFDTISTAVRHETSNKKNPGPLSLIQLSIWERGDVDMNFLKEKLTHAIRCALCDIVMEYRLLTAPLCEIPYRYKDALEGLFQSVPSSPVVSEKANSLPHAPLRKMHSESPRKGIPVTSPGTLSNTPSFLDLFSKGRLSFMSPSRSGDAGKLDQQTNSQEKLETDAQHKHELELKQKIWKYEIGERGILLPLYPTTMLSWLEFAAKLGVPSIQKFSGVLLLRVSVEFVLKEFQAMVSSLSPDITVRVFKHISKLQTEEDMGYHPYNPSRVTSMSTESSKESSLDMAQFACVGTPGKPNHYIVIGRNFDQWKHCIERYEEEDSNDQQSATLSGKVKKNYQKFCSLDSEAAPEKNSDLGNSSGLATAAAPSGVEEKVFVPRQRFLILSVKDITMELYTYNSAADVVSTLDRQFTRLIQWHNARTHLLSSILSQKAGLFQHYSFTELAAVRGKDANPYIQSADVDLLFKHQNPPSKPDLQRQRSQSVSMHLRPEVHPALPAVDELFRDTFPPHPLHRSPFGSFRDPVMRHGYQLREVREITRRESEKKVRLETIYAQWQQRQSNAAIAEDMLRLLKQNSHLVHNVTTPLLFSPLRRKTVIESTCPQKGESTTSTPHEENSRSRQNSGTSVKSKRSDSQQGKIRHTSTASQLSQAPSHESPRLRNPSQEEEEMWHVDLRTHFIQLYMQYLQQLGFMPVQVTASPKHRMKGKGEVRPPSSQVSMVHVVQKTLPGGIMLMELSFKDIFFCIKLFAFECSKLPLGQNVNSQLTMHFLDECDKMKDLSHVHSFAYDFHLRCVQRYIEGRPMLHDGYHLANFLADFIKCYPNPPSFSRNCVYEGVHETRDTNSPNTHLYDYILNHDKMYKMKSVKMKPSPGTDDLEAQFPLRNQYALVSHFTRRAALDVQDDTKQKSSDFNIGLVITHDAPVRYSEKDKQDTISLKYYVILTSKRDLYPILMLEKWLGMTRLTSSTQRQSIGSVSGSVPETTVYSVTPTDIPPLPVSQHINVRPETELSRFSKEVTSVNYLGFTANHQTPMYALLEKEQEAARERISQMVDNAKIQCRRDILWNRLLVSDVREDDKRKGRSDTEESRGDRQLMMKLSFAEFMELLEVVHKVPLGDIDSRLIAFKNMSIQWFQGLARVLMAKPDYVDNHRYFVSQDQHVQHVAIPNPNYLDTFILLSLDKMNNKADLCAVYRDTVEESSVSNPSRPAQAMQTHIEGFINACCYHMWAGIT